MRNASGMRIIADTNAEILASLGLWADNSREYMSGPTRYAEPTTNSMEIDIPATHLLRCGKTLA